jgi:hypothetical protein
MSYRKVRDQLVDQRSRERAEEARQRLKALRDKLAQEQRDLDRGRLDREPKPMEGRRRG